MLQFWLSLTSSNSTFRGACHVQRQRQKHLPPEMTSQILRNNRNEKMAVYDVILCLFADTQNFYIVRFIVGVSLKVSIQIPEYKQRIPRVYTNLACYIHITGSSALRRYEQGTSSFNFRYVSRGAVRKIFAFLRSGVTKNRKEKFAEKNGKLTVINRLNQSGSYFNRFDVEPLNKNVVPLMLSPKQQVLMAI